MIGRSAHNRTSLGEKVIIILLLYSTMLTTKGLAESSVLVDGTQSISTASVEIFVGGTLLAPAEKDPLFFPDTRRQERFESAALARVSAILSKGGIMVGEDAKEIIRVDFFGYQETPKDAIKPVAVYKIKIDVLPASGATCDCSTNLIAEREAIGFTPLLDLEGRLLSEVERLLLDIFPDCTSDY